MNEPFNGANKLSTDGIYSYGMSCPEYSIQDSCLLFPFRCFALHWSMKEHACTFV